MKPNKREPWLDWDNSLELAEKSRNAKEFKASLKSRRDSTTAFLLLLICGYMGFHRIYLYDSKMGWGIFWTYICFITCVALSRSYYPVNAMVVLQIAFIIFWALIVIFDWSFVKIKLREINREVDNYDN